jgi:hypothetical protein
MGNVTEKQSAELMATLTVPGGVLALEPGRLLCQ